MGSCAGSLSHLLPLHRYPCHSVANQATGIPTGVSSIVKCLHFTHRDGIGVASTTVQPQREEQGNACWQRGNIFVCGSGIWVHREDRMEEGVAAASERSTQQGQHKNTINN